MAALRLVVMGVSGCGKSTVGESLARALGATFVEGDLLHPDANVRRMAAGIALTDEDRRDWLDAVAARLAAAGDAGVVVACSALKRSYRDRLRASAPGLQFVYLHGEAGLLARRLQARQGHYMPASLLPSQLSTLEPPDPDERALCVGIDAPVDRLVATIREQLRP
jgi:carbohydrate kinase (thermoresistant glucokinase family)